MTFEQWWGALPGVSTPAEKALAEAAWDAAESYLRPEEAEKIALTPADAGRISEAICSILNLCDEHTAQQKAAMFAELDEARAVLWKAIDDQREPQQESP